MSDDRALSWLWMVVASQVIRAMAKPGPLCGAVQVRARPRGRAALGLCGSPAHIDARHASGVARTAEPSRQRDGCARRATFRSPSARRRCLFDHLRRLQDKLAGLGHPAGIDVDDASVGQLEQPSSLQAL